MGGSASFKMADELTTAVTAAQGGDGTRAILVSLDHKKERCGLVKTISGGMDAAWTELQGLLEDGVPSYVLFKDDDKDPQAGQWSLCVWIPEGTPVKPKMCASSAQKNVKEAFASQLGPWAPNFPMSEKSEVTLSSFQEHTQPKTEEDRRNAMTRAEIVKEESIKDSERERKSLEGKKIGMVGLGSITCRAHESFQALVKQLAQSSVQEFGVKCMITGTTNNNQVEAEEIDDVKDPTDLKGKLSDDVPCYVLMLGQEGTLVLISWLPENSPVKPRMNVSTFKRDVVNKIKEISGVDDIIEQECSMDDELTPALLKKDIEDTKPQAPAKPTHIGGPMAGAFKLPGFK